MIYTLLLGAYNLPLLAPLPKMTKKLVKND